MDIEQRIVTSDIGFRRLLDTNDVRYEGGADNNVVLKIKESDPRWPVVKEYITRNNILSLTIVKFTQREIDNAAWMTIRSKWRWEYPMPDDDGGYKAVVYNTEQYCEGCGTGLVQKDLFRVRKSPSWGTKHFLMLNWIEDELFVSEKAKRILEESQLEGLEFLNILKHKKETTLENIYQIKILNTLKPGFLPVDEIVKNHITCSICGSSKWVLTGKGFVFDESVLPENIDIAKTYERFGFGALAPSKILISHRFYKVLAENGLTNGLEFIPVNLNSVTR